MDKSEALGAFALEVLLLRQGRMSIVKLDSGVSHRVLTTSYGRDLGDRFDHIYTNNTPTGELPIDMFYSNEIIEISDWLTGEVLFEVGQT